MTTKDGTLGRYLAWFLAALSLGAGVIHFGVTGEHFDVRWTHGWFFAVVAWFQLCWAAAIVVRPDRRLLGLGAVVNLGIIAVWSVSRVWGVPVGPDVWEAEPVALADALSTGLEAGIVLTGIAVLAAPNLAKRAVRPALGMSGIGVTGLAIAVVSTMALSPSFASDHHHGEEDGHADSEEAGHSHGDGQTAEEMNMSAAEHEAAGHGEEAAGEEGGGHGHGEAAVLQADGTSLCEQSGIFAEGNMGHRGPVPYEPLTPEQLPTFRGQVEKANQAVAENATVADVEANGYVLITPYVPCIAAHYVHYGYLTDGQFDPAKPEIILFDGTEQESQVVGLSYLMFADESPEGFAGPNDLWHVHESLCIGSVVVGDEGTTDEECAERGGRNLDLGNLHMMHMWNAPGWDSPWGLFSGEHPNLGMPEDIHGAP